MFGKKFFSTITLVGTGVNAVEGVESFAKKVLSPDSEVVLTCEDDGVYNYEYYDKFYNNHSNEEVTSKRLWNLQDLVTCFRLERSEVEKILDRIRAIYELRYPRCCEQNEILDLGQVGVYCFENGNVRIEKHSIRDYSGNKYADRHYVALFDRHYVEEMLKTDLDTIDFSRATSVLESSSESKPRSQSRSLVFRMFY